MVQKIRQCAVLFDFYDPVAQLKSKEVKRAALNELIDHITTAKGVLQEPVYPEVIRMVRVVLAFDVIVFYRYLPISSAHCRRRTTRSLILRRTNRHSRLHGRICRCVTARARNWKVCPLVAACVRILPALPRVARVPGVDWKEIRRSTICATGAFVLGLFVGNLVNAVVA